MIAYIFKSLQVTKTLRYKTKICDRVSIKPICTRFSEYVEIYESLISYDFILERFVRISLEKFVERSQEMFVSLHVKILIIATHVLNLWQVEDSNNVLM